MDINFKEQELAEYSSKIKTAEESLASCLDEFEKETMNYNESQAKDEENLKVYLEKYTKLKQRRT